MPDKSLTQKGGRGKKAPYETKLMRVPVPLEEQIQEMIAQYQKHIDEGRDVNTPPTVVTNIATQEMLGMLNKIRSALKKIAVKVSRKSTGYQPNSFSQGMKDLKDIFEIAKVVNK